MPVAFLVAIWKSLVTGLRLIVSYEALGTHYVAYIRVLLALAIAVTTSSAIAQTKPKPKPTKPRVEYFANCKALNRKYPDGVSIKHPAYRRALDRDRDGWACERK